MSSKGQLRWLKLHFLAQWIITTAFKVGLNLFIIFRHCALVTARKIIVFTVFAQTIYSTLVPSSKANTILVLASTVSTLTSFFPKLLGRLFYALDVNPHIQFGLLSTCDQFWVSFLHKVFYPLLLYLVTVGTAFGFGASLWFVVANTIFWTVHVFAEHFAIADMCKGCLLTSLIFDSFCTLLVFVHGHLTNFSFILFIIGVPEEILLIFITRGLDWDVKLIDHFPWVRTGKIPE